MNVVPAVRPLRAADVEPAAPLSQRERLLHIADEIDLRALWLMIMRQRWLIAAIIIIPSILAFIVIKQIPSKYTANAYVMVEPQQEVLSPVTVNPKTGVLELPPDRIASEIQVIKSRDLTKKAVAKLNLRQDPEFNPALRKHGPLRDALRLHYVLPDDWVDGLEESLPAFLADALNSLAAAMQGEQEPGIDLNELAALSAFESGLDAQQVEGSRAIRISFSSVDPVKAAKIANTVVDLFIVSKLDADLEVTRRTNAWLTEQITQLRQQVAAAESAVEQYRAQSGLLRGRDVTFITQQVTDMSTELATVRADRARAEARLEALEGSSGLDDVAAVEGLEEVSQLRMLEAEAAQRLAALSKDLGPLHPRYISAEAELTQLRERIASAQARVIGGARSDATTARLRESTLAAEIEKLKEDLAKANEAEVKLNELQREADASRALLETFLSRSKEESMAQSFQRPDAKVLASADAPAVPSYPSKALLMILCVFVFGIAGVSTAFVVEAFDHGFRSGEQVERMTGLPSLGLVPALGGVMRPEDHIVKRPGSAFSEAIRNLYAGVVLPHREDAPKLFLITSSLPKEGKTTVTLSLGRLLAMSGKSVLVIDCDLRHPAVHKALSKPAEPGLAEVLLNQEPLENVIQQDPSSPLRVITAGASQRDVATLLGSDAMRELLRELRDKFDVVLLDAPPALAVTDPRLLASLVDKTIFLVRWGKGDRRGATDALRRLTASGADIAGVALTRVDIKRHARYGFSDSTYYGRALRSYYK